MITTERLGEFGKVMPYSTEALIGIGAPYGEDIPDEWLQKLGVHQFKQPVMAELRGVHLLGPAMVGVIDGDVILDTAYYGRFDLLERNRPYMDWAAQSRMVPSRKIDRVVLSLVSCWSGNYFHWLIDGLPKLEAAWEYKAATDEEPLLLIPNNPPAFIVDSLKECGLDYMVSDWPHYEVDRLLVPSTRREQGYVHPGVVEFLRDYFSDIVPVELNKWGRYYITRRNAKTRRVQHEEDLCRYLYRLNFSMVAMEDLTIQEQASLMAISTLVVAPHGSGLANIVFGNVTRVVELIAPQYTNPCCWLLGNSAGLGYGYVVGKPVGVEDMEIDLHKLEDVLNVL